MQHASNRQRRAAAWTVDRTAAFALALCVLAVVTANAQDGEDRSTERSTTQVDARRQTQGAYARKLEAFAAGKAPKGSPRYWAIIRTNIGRTAQADEAATRSSMTQAATSPDTEFADVATPSPLDMDPAAQKALQRVLDGLTTGEERVIGGQAVNMDGFTPVVSFATVTPEGRLNSFCSGSYIGPKSVLTAAHCICEWRASGLPGRVVFGADVRSKSDIIADYAVIDAVTRQADFCATYKPGDDVRGRDLALLTFDDRNDARFDGSHGLDGDSWTLHKTTRIWPIRIAGPSMYFSPLYSKFDLVGFGYNSNDVEKRIVGKKFRTSVGISDKICGGASSKDYQCRAGQEAVAVDYKEKQDSCVGDSGGPAFIQSGPHHYLAGVTSRGARPGRNCGPGGVYSLVTRDILDWIALDIGRRIVLCDSPQRCAFVR